VDYSHIAGLESLNLTGNPLEISSNQISSVLQVFTSKLPEDSPLKNLDLSSIQDTRLLNNIYLWLDKLKTAADFRNPDPKIHGPFIEQVLSVLELAVREPEFRDYLRPLLEDANTACVDRGVFGLNDVVLAKLLFEAKDKPLTDVLSLLKGAFTLESLQGMIQETPEIMQSAESVEKGLYLQNLFKQDFNLPIATQSMNYAAVGQVSENIVKRIRLGLQERISDPSAFLEYLISGTAKEVWKKKIKTEFAGDWAKIEEPFHEQLDRVMTDPSYTDPQAESVEGESQTTIEEKKANIQKSLTEPVMTAMREAEQKWLQDVTLRLLSS
jgi:hypothetical protein